MSIEVVFLSEGSQKNSLPGGFIGVCNGTMKGVPGGVVHIGVLASEGVMVVWYRRYTV